MFSLVTVNGRYSSLWYLGFSVWGLLLSRSTGSAVAVHRLSCSKACEIFLDQGSDPCICTGRWIPIHYTTREVLNSHSILLCLKDVQSISTYTHISFLNPVFKVGRMYINTLICLEHLAGKHSIFCVIDQKDGLDRVSSYWEGHWLTLKGCGGQGE